MDYVHLLPREGVFVNAGNYTHGIEACVQAALHTAKMYNSGANVPSGCLVQNKARLYMATGGPP